MPMHSPCSDSVLARVRCRAAVTETSLGWCQPVERLTGASGARGGDNTGMETGVSVAKPSDLASENETLALPAQACPLGGLVVLMRSQLTAATKHVGTCQPCQMELLSHGGIVPVSSRT